MLTDIEVGNLAEKMNIPFGGCFFKDEIPPKVDVNKVYIINLQDSETEDGEQNGGTHWTMMYVRETPKKQLQPIYFDPYGAPPPEIVKNNFEKSYNKKLPYTTKDIQSLMNNACGFYCLALGHFITASKHRSNDLYKDVDTFMDMFDDLNHSIDWKKNEYILKHFFLSSDENANKNVNVLQDHSFYDKIIEEDTGKGIDMLKLPVSVKHLNDI